MFCFKDILIIRQVKQLILKYTIQVLTGFLRIPPPHHFPIPLLLIKQKTELEELPFMKIG